MDTAERNTLSSALRVLDGLRVIAKARGPVPLAKLAAELDISEVAAFRIASTLIAGGYVRTSAPHPARSLPTRRSRSSAST